MNAKNNTTVWDNARGKIRSRKGGWRIGEGVFNHGYNMMDDLVGHVSYMQVMILNATGKLPSRQLADWFDAIHICLSWPDPRIWCNQIGALGGAARTTVVAATTAGILASDSRSYGIAPLEEGVKFIQGCADSRRNGLTPAQIVEQEVAKHGGKPYLMGYARPVAKGDERVTAMERVTSDLGFEVGEHLSLAYEIETILRDRFDEDMNINGYMSAFLSDQGLSPLDVYRICTVLVTSGITACYVDTMARPENTFLPMCCDDIEYQGKPPRALPTPEK